MGVAQREKVLAHDRFVLALVEIALVQCGIVVAQRERELAQVRITLARGEKASAQHEKLPARRALGIGQCGWGRKSTEYGGKSRKSSTQGVGGIKTGLCVA